MENGHRHSEWPPLTNVIFHSYVENCFSLFFLGKMLFYQHVTCGSFETREFLEVWRRKSRTKYWLVVSIICRFPCPKWKEEAKEDEVDDGDVPMSLFQFSIFQF